MKPDDAIGLLESEWERETGFFGKLRAGRFDDAAYARVVSTLERIDQTGPVVSSRFVALTWYIPMFLHWQKERCVERGYDATAYERASNRLSALAEELLGIP